MLQLRPTQVFIILLLIAPLILTQSIPTFIEFKLKNKQHISDLNAATENDSPVIGIVTQTLEDGMKTDPAFTGYTSYIMSSYVDFIMSAGARVVPLIYNED